MSTPRKKPARTRKPKAATEPKAKPAPKPKPIHLDRKAGRYAHRDSLTAAAYHRAIHEQLGKLLGEGNSDLRETAMIYVIDLLERMEPRDPMEEMLISQAIMAHVRTLHLSILAPQQQIIGNIRVVNEYADRASNTYRRLMLALAEYRKPPKAGDSYTAIGQANIAGQQVVVNGENKNATNEQGCDQRGTGHETIDHDGPTDSPEALPAEPRGPGIPPSVGSPDAPVGAVHRPEDG